MSLSRWPLGGRVILLSVLLSGVLGSTTADRVRAAAAEPPSTKIPDFGIDARFAWHEIGDEFLPPPTGAGPITNDPRYPYVDNGRARRTNSQPTYRIADLTNPILQPWVVEKMRKDNEAVLKGGVAFRPRERCYPGGVPEFVIYALVAPFYFLQTPKEVTIVNEGGPEIRRVYLNVPHSKQVTLRGMANR